MKQSHCIHIKCPHFIQPSRAGIGGGPMLKFGRCAVSKRMIRRQDHCPLLDARPDEKGDQQ